MDSTVTGVCLTDDSLLQRELESYKARTPRSFVLHQEALKSIPGTIATIIVAPSITHYCSINCILFLLFFTAVLLTQNYYYYHYDYFISRIHCR